MLGVVQGPLETDVIVVRGISLGHVHPVPALLFGLLDSLQYLGNAHQGNTVLGIFHLGITFAVRLLFGTIVAAVHAGPSLEVCLRFRPLLLVLGGRLCRSPGIGLIFHLALRTRD